MKLTNFVILIILILLTFLSVFSVQFDQVPGLLLVTAGLKFIMISFYFMEIKDANIGWKTIIFGYILLFSLVFLLI
ncbi:MAG: cytochrome C oxidase subunit IV family protein [Saprospiraceae bacterium]|nr:cytochrome C oxidase subunit IV family protein [Saprospiraceae bacterium]